MYVISDCELVLTITDYDYDSNYVLYIKPCINCIGLECDSVRKS